MKLNTAASPAENLIAFSELDYTEYRHGFQRLQAHPLFEPKLEISLSEFEDFFAEALLLPSELSQIDPISFSFLGEELHRCLQMVDDNSAGFWLSAAQGILRILEEPLRVQTVFRNIFEVTFDGTERLSQAERLQKLTQIYPEIGRAVAKIPRNFEPHSLLDFWLFQLTMYFWQDEQRIARCDYCWRYFIPKTKKATRYCDRVVDGQTCKQRGANLARREKSTHDEALLTCKRLRDRMYSRLMRWQNAPPNEREKLIPIDYSQYENWSENARLMRMKYLCGELTAEEFLRKIDITHELGSYDCKEIIMSNEPSVWQTLVENDIEFSPEKYFEDVMRLDLMHPNPEWVTVTADEQRKRVQIGHPSLKEKFEK